MGKVTSQGLWKTEIGPALVIGPGEAVPGRGHTELKTLGMGRVALLVRHWLTGSQGCEDWKCQGIIIIVTEMMNMH